MEQSQLVELLRVLEPEERLEVFELSKTKMFNNGRWKESLPLLLEVLLTAIGTRSAILAKKEEVFGLVFQGQKFTPGKIEKVMVEAHRLIKSYLSIKYLLREDNIFDYTIYFSEVIKEKGLMSRYSQILFKLKNDIKHDSQFYFKQYILNRLIRDLESVRNQVRGDLNIPETIFSLEIFYWTERIEHVNFYLLQQMVARLPDEGITDDMVNLSIPDACLARSEALKVNYEIYRILRTGAPTIEDAKGLLKMLQFLGPKIDSKNLRSFYTYLRNFIVIISNNMSDNVEMTAMLFELYKANLALGFLHYEGYLHPNTFLAVTIAALRGGGKEWAIEFIENYRSYLIIDNESMDYYRLNRAYYLFYAGKFQESLENIPPTFINTVYLLHSKRLELMAYYELQSELLTFKLDTFKMFISRTSSKLLSGNLRQTNADFINLLHQIVYSTPGDAKRSELLVKRVHERKQAAEWRWLLEKAQELRHR